MIWCLLALLFLGASTTCRVDWGPRFPKQRNFTGENRSQHWTGVTNGKGGEAGTQTKFSLESLTFLALGTGFMEDNFSTSGGWGRGRVQAVMWAMEGRVQAVMWVMGERWGAADEASVACLPLTSCCVAQLLTGHRPLAVRGPVVGDPCYRPFAKFWLCCRSLWCWL